MKLTNLIWLVAPFMVLVSGELIPTSSPDKDKIKSAKLPPCSACASFVKSFAKRPYNHLSDRGVLGGGAIKGGSCPAPSPIRSRDKRRLVLYILIVFQSWGMGMSSTV